MSRIAVFLIVAIPASVAAQQPAPREGLSLGGSVRLRYEAIKGQLRPGFNDAEDLSNIRTVLRADYVRSRFHVAAELWDSRVLLDDDRTPLTTGEVNAVEPVQAYAGVDLPDLLGTGSKVTVDAGRMLLNIASRRLVAADEYRNTTNGYTGVRLTFSGAGGLDGTLIYMLPQARLPDDREGLRRERIELDRESFDLVIWGGTFARARAIGPLTLEASFYHLGEDDAPGRPTRNRSLDTYGGRILLDPAPGRFDVEVEGFAQTGTIRASAAPAAPVQQVGAWMLHADAGYTFAGPWQPRVSVEYDQASGDRPGGHYGRFDTLFGMRRADFSPSGIFAAIGRANIVSPGVRIEVVPDNRTDAMLSARPYWLESATDAFATTGLRDASGRAGRFAGNLVDARVRYWLVLKRLRFEFDGVWMSHGRFLDRVANGPASGATTYLSSNLTATF